jgi:predicted metalloprotease with PDZ domain
MITYRVELADLHAHLFRVTVEVPRPAAEQRLSLPVWIPGSYMVREFGRHLSALQATQGADAVPLQQLDKTTWLARCSGRSALKVSYLVYAFDTSVRTAFLDARRGFFNNTSLCLRVEGREQEPHRLRLGELPAGWQVATGMREVGRRQYEAADYDELVDHPFELGSFWRGRFEAGGVPHEFVVAGALPGFDGQRLLADAQRICAAQIAFWHGDQPPPFERYVFLLNAVEDGYGGLEHRASTALIAGRRDLPRVGQTGASSDGYVTLLGLISHEYFHTWNVKRLKPGEFARFDYTQENYTELLWFFEGFTSYYDDLFLLRTGLIDEARYLRLLSKTLAGVQGMPGREVQSVAQASFDAWVKYYRADENTPNATVSYYTKGSLVALALDLSLRVSAKGASLDRVMQQLWQMSTPKPAASRQAPRGGPANSGTALRFLQTSGGPITENDIRAALEQVAGRPFDTELQAWVHGTDELPLAPLLAAAGVTLQAEVSSGLAAQLGLRLSESALTGVQVKGVLRGSAAERGGLSAGDELLAVQGWRVRRLDDALQWLQPGQPLELLVVRDQRVLHLSVTPPAAEQLPRSPSLALVAQPAKAQLTLRRGWLQGA